jgi:hypothetical protein
MLHTLSLDDLYKSLINTPAGESGGGKRSLFRQMVGVEALRSQKCLQFFSPLLFIFSPLSF